MGVLVFVIGLSVIAFLVKILFEQKFSYWKRIGVVQVIPSIPFGNLGPVVRQKLNFATHMQKFYEQFSDSYCGLYFFTQPLFLVNDPQLVQKIMIEDNAYFYNRNVYNDPVNDPMSGLLISLKDEKWKQIRTSLNPAFTLAKISAMFPMMDDSATKLETIFENLSNTQKVFDAREICALYSTHVIASVGFGCETDVMTNPNNPFIKMGRECFSPSSFGQFRMMVNFILPSVAKLFKIKFVSNYVTKGMIKIVKETIEFREQTNTIRRDFMQLLMQLKNRGKIQEHDNDTEHIEEKKLSLTEIAAQAFFLYVASFETASGIMSFLLYEISKNKTIQVKLQEENDRVMKKYGGKLTLEAITEMKYLEKCVLESLRKDPPLPFLFRACTKPYQIPGSDTVLEKDTIVLIPIRSIQNDKKYYANPQDFDPDREELVNFTENTTNPTFLPFGDGPRFCAGKRMGFLIIKVGMAHLLSKYNFNLGPNMKYHLEFDPKSAMVTYPKGGFQIQATKRIK